MAFFVSGQFRNNCHSFNFLPANIALCRVDCARRPLSGITPYLKPKFFLFSAGILICLVSLVLNIRFAERMQQLQDNDIKYRYLLMKGKADGNSLDLLEINFSRKRDNSFIRHLTDTVTDFEYRSRKQAEALERARLLDEQAKQLKKEADKLGKP